MIVARKKKKKYKPPPGAQFWKITDANKTFDLEVFVDDSKDDKLLPKLELASEVFDETLIDSMYFEYTLEKSPFPTLVHLGTKAHIIHMHETFKQLKPQKIPLIRISLKTIDHDSSEGVSCLQMRNQRLKRQEPPRQRRGYHSFWDFHVASKVSPENPLPAEYNTASLYMLKTHGNRFAPSTLPFTRTVFA